MTTEKPVIKPLFAKYCLSTQDGWNYYTSDYLNHVYLTIVNMHPNEQLSRKIHFQLSQEWENELEEANKLPKGHLRGIFDIHTTRDIVEKIAFQEKLRLVQPPPRKEPSSVEAHANLILMYQLTRSKSFIASIRREVVVESRESCNCVICLKPRQDDSQLMEYLRFWPAR